jgi:DNA invertase Pin-like site-specific DNA recombinase
MLIGYMRVSTKDQKLDLQHDALLDAGVQERYLYSDIASGAKSARPGLMQCLKALHPGDTLVAWKLDRLARSSLHLLELVQDLLARDIGLRILDGAGASLDIGTSQGKFIIAMLAAVAEFEREMIRERVIAGLDAARARGHKGGRREKLSPAQRDQAHALLQSGWTKTKIAQTLGCSRRTVYKALAQAQPAQAEAAD